MGPEIQFANIVVLQNGGVSSIWGVVGGAMVDRAPRGEGLPPLNPFGVYQIFQHLLQIVSQIYQQNSRFRNALGIFSNLSMNFGSLSKLQKHIFINLFFILSFFVFSISYKLASPNFTFIWINVFERLGRGVALQGVAFVPIV